MSGPKIAGKQVLISLALLCALLGLLPAQSAKTPAVLSARERAKLYNNWLKIRFDKVLPEIMRRENIDMWVVICREHNEDPVYTNSHPLGYHGHAAGPRIGLPDMQNGVPGMGDYPLFADTCWAIELSVSAAVPEWNHQEIHMALEQDAAFTARGTTFLDDRQTRFHLIR